MQLYSSQISHSLCCVPNNIFLSHQTSTSQPLLTSQQYFSLTTNQQQPHHSEQSECLSSWMLLRPSIVAGSKRAESYMEDREQRSEESWSSACRQLKQALSSLLAGPHTLNHQHTSCSKRKSGRMRAHTCSRLAGGVISLALSELFVSPLFLFFLYLLFSSIGIFSHGRNTCNHQEPGGQQTILVIKSKMSRSLHLLPYSFIWYDMI